MRNRHHTWLIGLTGMLCSQLVFAAGFEKGIMWSGKYSGIGNAAASSVHGAESLYFNPAGLPSGSGMAEVSGNFSPTLPKFTGQLGNTTFSVPVTEQNTGTQFSPVFGVLAS